MSIEVIEGDCLEILPTLEAGSVDCVVTSPPYNIGKPYERKVPLGDYVEWHARIISEIIPLLKPIGSLCWQVGNHIQGTGREAVVTPLDLILHPVFGRFGLKLRNRIVWHYGHGLHCSHRFSGRYEVILWYTASDRYVFNLDAVRVPQKYSGKRHYKGPRAGELSCNPLGKNPDDVWDIPNVKNNHAEKTDHPCQFPVRLAERLILALADPGGLVLDPFLGSGTTLVAAAQLGMNGVGIEREPEYCEIARRRIHEAQQQLRLAV